MTLALLRLARTDGIGPLTFRRLLARHRDPEAALAALPALSAKRSTPYVPQPESEARREIAALAKRGGRFVFLDDPLYPPLLALLPDAPPVLAVLGDASLLAAPAVAIVGARNASSAGRRVAEELAEALAAKGLTIVSGLARGIDTAAHEGALRGGPTIAVLPGGLDVPYPPENAGLAGRIAERGAVIAESPLGTAPLNRHFPRRNRIVAGLSLGVVVVEAAHRSGTLITARLALEHGREVFAVPGSPLDPRCRGANDLIRQGAHLTETAEDVLEHLPESPRAAPLFDPARMASAAPEAAGDGSDPLGPPLEGASEVLELIGLSPVSVDEVLRRCHLTAPELQAVLTELELEGRVELLPGHRVMRSANG
ncbi:DNA-protecting protein DprA [Roseomonas eburnea]|uniref:DNA-protecting protein DprA n=1 Tax=Neoroseomonas eburnea TaxID=1346889 RepID=A0A9X9X650_9PROT|nr:DNA-processing protein DprA [Neoroseomonas eburnea]MBR0679186.1 DNA-protecting protein DprA [Neoroseomonas eburnea]